MHKIETPAGRRSRFLQAPPQQAAPVRVVRTRAPRPARRAAPEVVDPHPLIAAAEERATTLISAEREARLRDAALLGRRLGASVVLLASLILLAATR